MSENILEVNDLTVEFHTEDAIVKAVEQVSFSVKPGQTLGIVGESGSGKSVSALSIMGLLPEKIARIKNGTVRFNDGENESVQLLGLNEKQMQSIRGNRIGMIFQEPMTSLNPVMRCGRQVAEVLIRHKGITRKAARSECVRLFEEVKLPRPNDICDSYPHQLSGGQKQRVMIAMALACKPALLIADEPTTALDVTVQKSILDLIRQLQQKYGMAVIFITHDLGVVAQLAHEVVVMYKGKIVEQGLVQEIFARPKHPYTRGLLACRPPLGKRPERLLSVEDFMGVSVSNHTLPDDMIRMDRSKQDEGVVSVKEITHEERRLRHEKLYRNEPLLRVKNLRTWFPVTSGIMSRTKGYVKAVDNVSFDVFPGETLGLVGESGCGKTTLGRTILRLVEPTGGSVEFEGREMTGLKHEDLRIMRRHMQIVFQDPYSSLNPRMTVGTAITEPMAVHGLYGSDRLRREKAMELLEKVQLKPEHFHRYPHEFSGGQRQRICIARALALEPGFIICDESVSALDVSVQAQVLNLLNQLKKDLGFTYIFISHDLNVVKYMSDRLIVMKDGHILEQGEADKVYSNPETDYTKGLINAIPTLTNA
ncbi:MAG: ABC transporter ATP-binding protein [Bacteroidota bacterium]|nr:ABC transporter ATP-binding protein [Bacteroidota bacterium]